MKETIYLILDKKQTMRRLNDVYRKISSVIK